MLMPRIFSDNFDMMDRYFNDPWFGFTRPDFDDIEKKLYGHRAKNIMSTDIRDTEEGYEMIVDLPGFSKEDVSIELKNGYLVISARKGLDKDEAENEEERAKGNYIRRERYSGSCQRSYYVGNALTHEDIKAKFEHGILTVFIPKKDQKKLEEKKYIAIEG